MAVLRLMTCGMPVSQVETRTTPSVQPSTVNWATTRSLSWTCTPSPLMRACVVTPSGTVVECVMIGPSGLISTLRGPTVASTAVPMAIEGRMSMTSTSIPLVAPGAPAPGAIVRKATMRVPSRWPTTMEVSSSPMTSLPTMPRLSCGRPDSDRVCPVSPSKAVIATSTGEPSVMSRPLPSTRVVAFVPVTSRGALISIVGVAPTRPETATRSKRGSGADCGLGSAVTSVALGSAGWRAHHAMPPPAARSTRARRRRPSSEAREEPRERSPLAAARCEEPFARRAREESGVCEAELMPES